ncbi:hypothetical protein LZ519_03555 [Sphingomonas sp. RG327]|uniref:Uncharacterized protein n=1 Tax=Sphingomonas anseongensis TaxID=2908207 RepID=A0ABT0RDS1_9SPHN|nr:hypothetical protein [Sphingomonas anseongensis]MCL6678393.1 hypothetical protein [Sphingomonas anseongensis]
MEQIAALRAEWFAQLAEAIDGAQHLAWQLGTRESTSAEARELYGRLEAARQELDSLRGLQIGGLAIDPDWLQKLGFQPGPELNP